MPGMNGTRLRHVIVENETLVVQFAKDLLRHRNQSQNACFYPRRFQMAVSTKETLNRVPFGPVNIQSTLDTGIM
jgi:hypothetical protein